jgi:hypothetical protein
MVICLRLVLHTLVVECLDLELIVNFIDHEVSDDTKGFAKRRTCFKVGLFWC